MKRNNLGLVKKRLDEIYMLYDRRFIYSDPVELVHRFSDARDIEIAGLLASSLAYGRVESIKKAIEKVMDVMDWKPYRFVMEFSPKKDGRLFEDFLYRFNDGRDIAALLYFAKQMIAECGSIEGFFLKGYSLGATPMREALERFTESVLSLDSGGIYGTKGLPSSAGVRFFFPAPSTGSACKRLNLYLRWMVRREEPDFGIWKRVSPSDLIIPLDTHMARISRLIGLTGRRNPCWKMAEEITATLKRLAPEDPVKYDFAITRLGILEECKKGCRGCRIKDICVEAEKV